MKITVRQADRIDDSSIWCEVVLHKELLQRDLVVLVKVVASVDEANRNTSALPDQIRLDAIGKAREVAVQFVNHIDATGTNV